MLVIREVNVHELQIVVFQGSSWQVAVTFPIWT